MKIAFSLECCTSALPEITQLLLDFFNLVDPRLILTPLYDSLNIVTNAFSSGLSGGGHALVERKSTAPQQLDCAARTMRESFQQFPRYFTDKQKTNKKQTNKQKCHRQH